MSSKVTVKTIIASELLHITSGAVAQAKILDILKSTYIDPHHALDSALQRSDQFHYVLFKDRLIAFWFTRKHLFQTSAGGAVPALYLGLSATASKWKNTGIISRLYFTCFAKEIEAYAGHRSDYILWGLTAHPTIYRAISRFLSNVCPRENGSYDQDLVEVLQLARNLLKVKSLEQHSDHPHIIRGAGGVYTSEEMEKINRIALRKGFKLFEQMKLCLKSGDRILFLARFPKGPISFTNKQSLL